MKKYLPGFIILLLPLIFFVSPAFAAAFSLDKIGTLSTNGKMYSEWWYTVANPTLSGMTDAGKEVSIKIDDATFKVTAGSSGAWSYNPTTLTEGDRKIAITAPNGSYSFTLHVGQGLPSTISGTRQTTQSTGSVPVTGSNQLAGVLMGTGLVALAWYFYNKNHNGAFEKNAVKGL
jgi:hypothetical protein